MTGLVVEVSVGPRGGGWASGAWWVIGLLAVASGWVALGPPGSLTD